MTFFVTFEWLFEFFWVSGGSRRLAVSQDEVLPQKVARIERCTTICAHVIRHAAFSTPQPYRPAMRRFLLSSNRASLRRATEFSRCRGIVSCWGMLHVLQRSNTSLRFLHRTSRRSDGENIRVEMVDSNETIRTFCANRSVHAKRAAPVRTSPSLQNCKLWKPRLPSPLQDVSADVAPTW